jgi:hypothetical protein
MDGIQGMIRHMNQVVQAPHNQRRAAARAQRRDDEAREPLPREQCRVRCKKLTVTWPQTGDLPKAFAGEHLRTILAPWGVLKLAVVSELHKDGHPHLHAAAQTYEKIDLRFPDFDVTWGGRTYQGRYEPCKSWPAWIRYLSKGDDASPYEVGFSLEEERFKLMGVSDRVAVMLKDGASVYELLNKFPGFVMQHLGKIRDLQRLLEIGLLRPRPPRVAPMLVDIFPFDPSRGRPIIHIPIGCGWDGTKCIPQRKYKDKQYWIWGPPNVGKTYILNTLQEIYKFIGYDLDCMNDHFEWRNDWYDFCFIDDADEEILQKISYSRFIKWMAGDKNLYLNVKHLRAIKNDNITCIIFASDNIDTTFAHIKSKNKLASIHARFIEIDATIYNLRGTVYSPAFQQVQNVNLNTPPIGNYDDVFPPLEQL